MATSRLNPQAPGRPPWTPVRSGGPQWVGQAAAAWSLVWAARAVLDLRRRRLPVRSRERPYAAKVSILEHVQQDATAPAIAVLGLAAAVLAMAMAHGHLRRLLGAALLGFAWTMAVTLTVVLPDVRPLTSLARTPVILIGMPFGWPPGIGFSTLYPWPVINQLVLILGGLLWAATAIAYQRKTRNACGRCGRTDATTGWTTPASAARWGRWATFVAVTVPVLYALTRWAWALGIPLGVAREFLREQARETPDIWLAGAALATWRSAARPSPWGSCSAGARSSPAGSRSSVAGRSGRARPLSPRPWSPSW